LIGKTIDARYRVRRLLGRGGMGAVYEAEHVGLGKRVAVKFITGEIDPDTLARFRREARVAGQLAHDHVVEIYDVGEDDGHAFIAMEYVEGRDLRSVLKEGRLDAERAIAIARQILAGVAAIHDAGIVHRDIKPANVLLAAGDAVKLMDFGISKAVGDAAEITKSGTMVGTPQYMAPEQLMGGEVDHRADLYAVGLTLYAMLTGEPPFSASSTMEVAAMQLRDPPPSLDRVRPGLPRPLVRAIERALEKAPRDRFDSARAFAAALDSEPTTVAGGTTAETRRERSATPPARTVEPVIGDPELARKRAAGIAAGSELPFTRPERKPMRAWVPISLVALAAAFGIAIAVWPREDVTESPQVYVLEAGVTATDPLVKAREAERAGKLELAVAHYLEAHATAPDPDLLYRIGELYERMNRTSEAVMFLRRYLEEAPQAKDRDAVAAKIARLVPTPPDAGVAATRDAGVVRTPPRAIDAGVAPRDPTMVCYCQPEGRLQWMCKRRYSPPLCRCEVRTTALCPEPFKPCPEGRCATEHVASRNDDRYSCAIGWLAYYKPAEPGTACTGYAFGDITKPADAATAPLRDGKHDCSACRFPDMTTEQFRAQVEYDGLEGASCRGYLADGVEMVGRIRCKKREK
jgi:tRNA A-37 threonylcarbamoyl transferase component Bud32/tetratricopeptide (TPR) repeat protein